MGLTLYTYVDEPVPSGGDDSFVIPKSKARTPWYGIGRFGGSATCHGQ